MPIRRYLKTRLTRDLSDATLQLDRRSPSAAPKCCEKKNAPALAPWTPSWDAQPNFHDAHHERVRGNYGLLGLLDWAHGTTLGLNRGGVTSAKRE